MAQRRLNKICGHLAAPAPQLQAQGNVCVSSPPGNKGAADVVVVSALRTPIGRAKKGAFKNTTPDVLLRTVLEATIKRTGIKPEIVGDVCVGNVQLGGAYAGPARMAQLCSGFPETVPLSAVNRQCSSGLQAVANIANSIASGQISVGIGAGVESMTHGGGVSKDGNQEIPPMDLNAITSNDLARQCLLTMGQTSENVAERYGITREVQDKLALASHEKALRAQKEGRFKNEIVPVTIVEEEKEVVISADDGPRESTFEGLSKLKPAFGKKGSTTAGNASQVSDGAAAVLLMRRDKAQSLGLPVLGTMRGFQVAGVKPDEMGIGPAVAIPAVLKQTGLKTEQIDVYEINEAFASQAAYCVQKLGIPMEKVNPNGGAIALGHPLGMTGARQIATLLNELKRTNKKLGVVSMCIGTGMGAAAVFEAE